MHLHRTQKLDRGNKEAARQTDRQTDKRSNSSGSLPPPRTTRYTQRHRHGLLQTLPGASFPPPPPPHPVLRRVDQRAAGHIAPHT
jgi:hypothetical protein